jgi:hypothetical protein
VALFELGGRQVADRFVQPVVVEPADVPTIASSSWLRVRQTRSAISSVLNESTKLSASALS